jgi:hypothetical protein
VAAAEIAIMESTTTKFAKSTTTKFAAAETAIMKCRAAMVAAGEATMEAAAAKAAAVETAASPEATSVAPTTAAASATTRQRHGWRSQTNRRNCQQRDHRLTQHCRSPSEISLPTSALIAGGNRSGETLLALTSLLLNSARAPTHQVFTRLYPGSRKRGSLTSIGEPNDHGTRLA